MESILCIIQKFIRRGERGKIPRKKNFVLLELLIGFALVTTFILPFLRYPHRHIRHELDCLFEMKLHQYGQNRLIDIEVDVYKNLLDKKNIFGDINKTYLYTEGDKEVFLTENWKRNYHEKVTYSLGGQKKDSNNVISSLVHLNIHYYYKNKNVATFHRELIAQKKKE